MVRIMPFLTLLIFTSAAVAGTDCRIVDKEDHVELICVGDETLPTVSSYVQGRNQPSEPRAREVFPSPEALPSQNDIPYVIRPGRVDVVKRFHDYMEKNQKRVNDFAAKKASRNRAIQEEMRRNPPQPMTEPVMMDDAS